MAQGEPYLSRQHAVRNFMNRLGTLPAEGGGPAEVFLLLAQDGVGWEDLYYLTGFAGSSGALLLTQHEARLFVDPRYIVSAKAIAACEVVCCVDAGYASPLQALMGTLARMKPSRVAYGGRHFPHTAFRLVEGVLDGWAETTDLSGVLLHLRRHKSAAETARIEKAVAIASAAFLHAVSDVAAGVSEREFACRLEYALKSLGGDFVDPVPVMVASGERTALPHATPEDRKFAHGDLVTVDFGARSGGYVCDITRMLSIGEPSEEARSLHAILKWAQTEAASQIRPGVPASEVDGAARGVMEGAKLGPYFVHGTGHGIGLSIHEPPALNAASGTLLAEGDVVAIEPGFYRPGWGGMRIEDNYLVTESGARRLTDALPVDLIVV